MRQSRKKQRDLAKSPQFLVKILYDHRKTVTRDRDPNDSWSADDIEHSYSINGFEVVQNGSWDFVLTKKPTGLWYLICAYYSTGDSFHHEDGKLSLVSFVKAKQDAEAIIRVIQTDYEKFRKTDKYEYSPLKVNLPIAGCTEEIYSGTWKGYFERLSYVEATAINSSLRVKFD